MTDDTGRKTEPPLHLDMEFDEALRRFAQTKPEEVEPPKARKRKPKRSPTFPLSGPNPPKENGQEDRSRDK